MEISLHDNWVYAHCVDYDSQMIVLHTVYPHSEPYEFTDVIFAGALVHHFEMQCMTTDPRYPSRRSPPRLRARLLTKGGPFAHPGEQPSRACAYSS
jgi:hypothetical protein